MPFWFLSIILFCCNTQVEDVNKTSILYKINTIRTSGCKCGSEMMTSVKELEWNDLLQQSAMAHAEDMNSHDYFSHLSRDGKNIGQRIDDVNYNWKVVGENIAEGQRDFNEVLYDWLKSPSHCKMIMDPEVEEMAVAKSGKYWVQHFGKRKAAK